MRLRKTFDLHQEHTFNGICFQIKKIKLYSSRISFHSLGKSSAQLSPVAAQTEYT